MSDSLIGRKRLARRPCINDRDRGVSESETLVDEGMEGFSGVFHGRFKLQFGNVGDDVTPEFQWEPFD